VGPVIIGSRRHRVFSAFSSFIETSSANRRNEGFASPGDVGDLHHGQGVASRMGSVQDAEHCASLAVVEAMGTVYLSGLRWEGVGVGPRHIKRAYDMRFSWVAVDPSLFLPFGGLSKSRGRRTRPIVMGP
jgi:hypothetical protein